MKKLIFFILVNYSFISFSQQKDMQFIHLSTDQGLSNSEVNDIKQDKQGFIWIATSDGLNLFDGYNFKVYRKIPNDSTSLINNYISIMLLDFYGNLWLGTHFGISLFNKNNNSFSNYIPDKKSYQSRSANSVSSIIEDKSHNLYASMLNGKIYEFDKKSNSFKFIIDVGQTIESLFTDSHNSLWVAADSIYVFDEHKNKINVIYNNSVKYRYKSILEDSDKYWISTLGSGLFWYDKKTKSFSRSYISYKNNDEDIVNKIYKDKENNIWICNNVGLKLYDKKKDIFYNYFHDEKNNFSLSAIGVKTFFEDYEGNYWCLCIKGGVNLAEVKKQFKNLTHNEGNKISLTKSIISSILVDNQNKIWAGSFNNGLDVIYLSKEIVRHYENEPQNSKSLGRSSVLMLFKDSKGNIWIGTYRGGLQKFDKVTGNFITYQNEPGNENSIGGNDIRSMAEDKDGNFWIVVHGYGIDKFDIKNNVFYHFRANPNSPQNSLADDWPFVVLCDNENTVWVGTPNGLSKLNADKTTFTNYQNIPNDNKSLSSNFVICLFEDSHNKLWIGTQEGLDLYNKTENNFTPYYLRDGLPNNVINGILEDNHNNLWISTNKGLSKFNQQKKQFRNYDTFDGIVSDEFYTNASYCSTKGEMFFGSNSGITSFFPDSINNNSFKPPVFITDFKIFNKSVPVGQKGSPLKTQISSTKKIVLSYNQSVISFEFVALNYIQAKKNQYAYIMDGFEKSWNYIGTKRDVTYTNLEPGKYVFKVIASNNDLIWNETGTSVELIILPPFWKTWWFRSILLVVILALIYLMFYLRLAFYRKQGKELTILVKERTSELEEINIALEEKQEEILLQKEELLSQKDALEDTNKVLIQQKQQIVDQNNELDKHRNELESLVFERTSELEEAKKRAEESDKLKSAFLANMSHEIRTPMNAIIGFSSIMRDQNLSKKEREDIIGIIINNGEYLMGIINDILDISKIQANQITLSPLHILLPSLLKELHENFIIEAEKNNITLTLSISNLPSDFILNTDKLRLKQVFSNIIQNAIKFTQTGGVEFGVKELNENITFYVKDTGIGIPPEMGNSIFERFQKVESKNQLFSGTGLGLAICKSLIELWGGEIWYESVLDKGTTFYFTHPLSKLEEEHLQKEKSQKSINIPDLSGKTILVAEDHENNFKLLKVYLSKTKAMVIHAKNGKEAVDHVEQHHVDIILMDLKMPVMDGFEATRLIRKNNQQVPIIAQTAYAFENEKNEFMKFGINDFIIKPIQLNNLILLLTKYI